MELAIKLARFYEQSQNSQPKKGSTYKFNYTTPAPYKSTTDSFSSGTSNKSALVNPTKNLETVTAKPRPLTYSQREERRQKGLCFYCDEKFVKGHECKKPQNFLMIAEEELSDEYEGAPIFEDPTEKCEKCDWQEQKIVLAAMGIQEVLTKGPLHYTGCWNGKIYKILIDGGSSLNIISHDLCKDLGLQVMPQNTITMSLPNGTTLTSSAICPELKMSLEGTQLTIKPHVATLQDWQLVLGVEWLILLGDFKCNYHTKVFCSLHGMDKNLPYLLVHNFSLKDCVLKYLK